MQKKTKSAKLLSNQELQDFCSMIKGFYKQNKRYFPWRMTDDSYAIFVSEVMLQQTQTERVVRKYEQFMQHFPSWQSVAQSSLHEIMKLWQGLGYNRRARVVFEGAQKIVNVYQGLMPSDPVILETFYGIGAATAGSLCAFAYNMPTVFIETNIRSVFLHTFFNKGMKVTDAVLMPLIAQTLDQTNPREWYYALMDYGVFLKKNGPNPSLRSAHHTKQKRFIGSDRQLRGKIIVLLTQADKQKLPLNFIIKMLRSNDQKIKKLIQDLIKEKLLQENKGMLSIP
ncbi:MAG: hypothetical protein WBQ73_02915 [Candidatus Babeliales bacterium]